MPKAISLFAGAGGCSLGFRQAGYDIIYASDINSQAIATYNLNFPQTHSVAEDIAEIEFEQLLGALNLRPGEIDIMIGGPPCQGFSSAGSRFWDDPRNLLLKQYLRALEVVRPKWFLMENVEGLLTANKGQYLYEVTKAVLSLGYKVRIDKVYAHEYGVPQRRKRVFVVGNRLGHRFELPVPLYRVEGGIYRHGGITLHEAISGLPQVVSKDGEYVRYDMPPSSEWERKIRSTSGMVSLHIVPRLSEERQARIRALKPGQTMKNLPEHLQHASFKRRAYRRVMDGIASEKRGGAPAGLKRLKSNEPSLTITSASTQELIHPTEDRPLTIRECARLQTFPDGFEFNGSASQKIQQIGNAIPPLLAEIFAKHIMTYGFHPVNHYETSLSNNAKGELVGFSLSKTSLMSPALKRTHRQLRSLMPPHRQVYIQATLF